MTTPVLCGGCQQYHGGAADVRKCFSGQRADYNYPDREMAERRLAALGHVEDMAEFTDLLSKSSLGRHKEPVPEGLYAHDGHVYKVVTAVHGSGHRYAKVLMPPELGSERGSWIMAKGMVFKLSVEDLMTADKAAEFGALYSICCNCGLPLTREESKRRHYGPTCADKLGWPYDHNAD